MRKENKNIFSRLVVSFVAIAAILAINTLNYKLSSSETTTYDCNGLSMTATNASGAPSTTLSGEANIKIATPSTPQPIKISITANSKLIGQAQPSGTNAWQFRWATTLWPTPGSIIIGATAYYSDGHICPVANTTNYHINSQQVSLLSLSAQPSRLDGYTNYSQLITITGAIAPTSNMPTAFSIDPYTIFEWPSTISVGTLYVPTNTFLDNSQRNFSSGNIAGTASIVVRAIYGGADVPVTIPVTVNARPTTTTNPDTSTSSSSSTNNSTPTDTNPTTSANSDTSTNTTASTATAMTETQVASSRIQVSTITQSCIESEITADRYSKIVSQESTITTQELDKTVSCFATSKYILPTSFSPVDPTKVEGLSVDNSVTAINKMENVTKTVDSVKKDTLKISGKAKPKTTVLIYIFSDPLIITTTSDSDGNWEYTLEDPLQPGKHEVYSVVNNGDGSYKRSDPLSFLISTVAATDANPSGLNLKLAATPTATATQSNRNLIYYIAGSIVAVAIAIISLFIAIRIHLKHKPRPVVAAGIDTAAVANTTIDTGSENQVSNQMTFVATDIDQPPTIQEDSAQTTAADSLQENSIQTTNPTSDAETEQQPTES